jgi:hypothetical protein
MMDHIKPENVFAAFYEDGNLLPEELQHASRCRYCHEWLIISLDIAAHGGMTPKFTVPKLEERR